jgi:fatty-acid desaturase
MFVAVAWYFGAQALYDVLTNFSTNWYWYVLATVYAVGLNEVFGHIICAHKSCDVSPKRWTYKLLVFLFTVDHAWSPVTGLCRLHENHHLYADQGDKDNLNWRLHWFSLCSLSPITFIYSTPTVYPDYKRFLKKQEELHAEIINDPWTNFCENNKVLLTLAYWGVLFLVAPAFLFYVVLMGRFLLSIFMVMAAICGHTKIIFGYRNFDSPDTTHNNLIFHYIALGLMPSMLQNNHHGSAKVSIRWFEFDTCGLLTKLLAPMLRHR